MVELAGLLPWLGDLVRAESLLDEALAAARSSGDRLAEGRVLLERLDLAWLQGSEDAGEARKIEVERLLPIFEVGDDSLGMARAWMTLGSADSIACRFDQAIEAYKRCGKEAERAGSAGEELARRSRQLILECAWLGSTSRAEGIGLCRAAIDRPGGDLTDRASGLEVLGCLLAMSGDFGAARASRDESRLIYQDLGLWFDLAVGHESAGFIEQLAGDLMTAELEFRRGFEMLMERGDHAHASTMLLELAFALIRQGRLEEAQGCVSRCEELSPTDDVSDLGLVASAKARILSGRRADSDAVAEAQRGVDIFEHTEQPNALADALITLSVVVLQAGDRSHASSAAARALGLYEMKGNLVSAASTRSLIDRIAADP
jgi:tetratricopeptide (TPR) repeat protein